MVLFALLKYSSGKAWYLVINVPGIVLATAVPNPDKAALIFTMVTKGKTNVKSIAKANVSNPNIYVARIPTLLIKVSWKHIANTHATNH